MSSIHEALNDAIEQVSAARKRLARRGSKQVRGVDDIASLKATAQTWFYTHREKIVTANINLDLSAVDEFFTEILNATAKAAAKATYLRALKGANEALISVRARALTAPVATGRNGDDLAPDFSPLAGNQQMRDILTRRWNECARCVQADAHLAAIVMMGGLLEALFVARANKLVDKKPLVTAACAPKDKTGNTINYQKWMLDSYIKVGAELKWITESAKGVADNIKEYRNFVHPAKELQYGVILERNDSSIFWQVTKALARQLLLSASP